MATTALEANLDQIEQNTKKWIVSAQDQSHALLIANQSTWWKEVKIILLGVSLSITESYMIITNILKAINSEEQ